MTSLKSKTLAALLTFSTLPMTAAVLLHPVVAVAQSLPNPYVSRALDAVLLPIDDAVIGAFGLAANETGVLVLAVQPGGIAELIGVEPGDVISSVRGYAIADPVELDAVVYYWIGQNQFDFVFDGWRAGSAYASSGAVSYESYMEVIEVTTIETWTSYSYESFSYSEFYAEYSEVIAESYETSESYIEEYTSSEEFTSEIESEMTDEAVTDEAVADEDTDADGTPDATDTDDDNDGIDDDADSDDNGDGADDGAVDEGAADEGADDSGGDVVEE